VIVEMAGLPLAGKSTFRAALSEHLARAGVDVIDRRAVRTRRRVLVRHTRLLLLVIWVLVRSPRPVDERVGALRFVAAALTAHEAMRGRRGVALLDEGVVQRAFLLFVDEDSPPSRRLVERYARLIPRPDLVVVVLADVDDVLQRAAGRARGLPPRLARLDPRDVRAKLVEGAALLDDVIELAPLDARRVGTDDVGTIAAEIQQRATSDA
jgi:thymidylate kinase